MRSNPNIQGFGAHIKVADIDKSLEFYRALGFEETFAYGSNRFRQKISKDVYSVPDKYNDVVFTVGDAVLEIGDGHLAVKQNIFSQPITSSKVSAMVYVRSLNEIETRCAENKIILAVPPHKFPWGTRELVVRDPDGYVLVFIEKLKRKD